MNTQYANSSKHKIAGCNFSDEQVASMVIELACTRNSPNFYDLCAQFHSACGPEGQQLAELPFDVYDALEAVYGRAYGIIVDGDVGSRHISMGDVADAEAALEIFDTFYEGLPELTGADFPFG